MSNLLDTTTNPDHPTLGKRFWSFIKSNVGISSLKENGEGEAVHDSKKKANLLSEQFKSVFTQEDLENLPSLPQAFPSISQLNFDTIGIAKLLSNLNVEKAAGPDQIPCWVLKKCSSRNRPFPETVFLTFIANWGHPPGLEKRERTCHLQKRRQITCLKLQTHLSDFCLL